MNPHLQEPQQLPVISISPRLRADRNMGDLGPLAADIAERGLRHPVTVARDGALVIGARRLAACALAGVETARCWRVAEVADVIAVIGWENADDLETGDAKWHLPATLSALAAQDAAMRELAWWARGGAGRPGGARDHRHQLSEALSGPGETGFVNGAQYRQLVSLAAAARGWQAGPGGYGRLAVPRAARQAAVRALAELGHRDARQVGIVYRRWQAGIPQTQPAVKALTPADAGSLLAVITGFTDAIASTGIPGESTPGSSVDEIDEALSALIRTLGKYRRNLRQSR